MIHCYTSFTPSLFKFCIKYRECVSRATFVEVMWRSWQSTDGVAMSRADRMRSFANRVPESVKGHCTHRASASPLSRATQSLSYLSVRRVSLYRCQPEDQFNQIVTGICQTSATFYRIGGRAERHVLPTR